MSQIFISYARKDSDEVYPIVDMLESNGFKCWIDKDGIESGDQFKSIIIKAINESEVFLYMLSDNAVNSEWVKKEFGHATRKQKRIIPIFLKGASQNDYIMFDFSHIDYIDICAGGWKEKLLRDLRKQVEKCNPSGDVNGKGSFDNPSPNSQTDKHPTFTVVLKSCGINKINVMMKIVDQKLAPDLAKANSIIDTKPSVLWTGADANKAEQLKKTFEALGAEIEIISKKQGPKPSTSNSSESSHASKDETEVGIYEVVCSICGKKEKKFFDQQEVKKGLGLALLFQPLLALGIESGTKKVWQKMGGSYICPECKAKQEKES